MATLKDYRDERLRKLEEIKNLGINAYPSTSRRDHKLAAVHTDFAQLAAQETSVTVAGRIKSIRKFGKIAFVVIRDDSAELQLFLKHDSMSDPDRADNQLGFSELNLLDSGDFIEASGVVAPTQTGEESIIVQGL